MSAFWFLLFSVIFSAIFFYLRLIDSELQIQNQFCLSGQHPANKLLLLLVTA